MYFLYILCKIPVMFQIMSNKESTMPTIDRVNLLLIKVCNLGHSPEAM